MSVLIFAALTLLVLSHVHALQYAVIFDNVVMSDKQIIAAFHKPKGMIGKPFQKDPVLNEIHTYKTIRTNAPFADWSGVIANVGTNVDGWAHYLSRDVYNDEFIPEDQTTDWYEAPKLTKKTKKDPINLLPFWILLGLVIVAAIYRFIKVKH